jgi:aconitate hydratase
MDMAYPRFVEPRTIRINEEMLVPPPQFKDKIELEKGPNIKPLPGFDPLPDTLRGPVLLKMGDDISTDEILPAGAKVLPYRSNIPEISKYAFSRIDETYYDRAIQHQKQISFVVAGINYGQGSSREHAVIGPRYLGLRTVLAKKFARIHWQNLINFGILPLTFSDPDDWDKIDQGDVLTISDARNAIQVGTRLTVINERTGETYPVEHTMSARQVSMVLEGSLINLVREKQRPI